MLGCGFLWFPHSLPADVYAAYHADPQPLTLDFLIKRTLAPNTDTTGRESTASRANTFVPTRAVSAARRLHRNRPAFCSRCHVLFVLMIVSASTSTAPCHALHSAPASLLLRSTTQHAALKPHRWRLLQHVMLLGSSCAPSSCSMVHHTNYSVTEGGYFYLSFLNPFSLYAKLFIALRPHITHR